jgi:pentatricopeptide repeat protein
MYAACGNIAEAENVFDSLPQRDVAAWNAMLTGYVDRGRGHEALQLYSEMLEAGMNPNQKTFVVILHACTILVEKEPDAEKTALFDLASAIHADLRRWGFEGNVFIGNTLVSIYGKLGKLTQAEDVFARMLRHETVSWNAMLSAYVERNEGEAALELYGRMRQENAIANDVTHLCLLQACGAIGSLEVCHEIHFSMVSAGYDHNAPLLATLIHTYGSCSSMEDAASLFQAVLRPDIVSWNAYIAGHAGVGSYEESARLLDEMHRQGIEPDGITLASVLSACSHGGLVDQGLDHFEDLCTRFGISPDLKHYSTVIDLLGRAGGLTMLEDLLARMPVEADLSIWLPLLGACRLHGNADLGKQAFANAVDLKPTRASAYVIMSNIYADLELKAEDG